MKKKIASQIIFLLVALLPLIGLAQPGGQPDLIISNLEVIDPISPNYDISYRYQITNIGDETANADDVSIQAYISSDAVFSPQADIPAGGRVLDVSGIQPGQTITQSFGATVNFDVKSTPYLTMRVDWQDGLDEADESNNTAWTHIIEPQPVPLNVETVNSQIIIQYSQLTAIQIAEINAILLSLGGVVVDECNCNRSIAVWQFGNPEDAAKAAEEVETYGRTESLDEKADVDGNELILIKERRPLIGFELKSSETLPEARRNITVYLIDSGVDTDFLPANERNHLLRPAAPFLCGNLKSSGFNYQFPPNVTQDFDDENGHGTFGYRAITKDVSNRIKVVPMKVFDENGEGTLFSIICAIYHAIDNGADIINISAGYEGEENEILKNAVKEAGEAGIFIVAAAGNDEKDIDRTPYYPASFAKTHKNVISVASQNLKNDKLGKCSNHGEQSVTLSAPGENICGYNHKGHKVILSGTSMAAFYVTRELAIQMAARNPGSINVENVRNTFVNQQKSNCLKNSSKSGRCLDVDSEPCNIIFEWLIRLIN